MSDSQNLHRVGLKATPPRLRILELLKTSAERHLSADEIYKRLAFTSGEIGMATIYRALTQLEGAGLLRRTTFETGRAVFELEEGHHHDHMVCIRCGHVDEFHDPTIEARQAEVAKERGFELQEHRHSLFGLCAQCSRSAATSAES